MNLLLAVARPQKIKEVVKKLSAVILDIPLWVFTDKQDLSDMAFALDVAVINRS